MSPEYIRAIVTIDHNFHDEVIVDDFLSFERVRDVESERALLAKECSDNWLSLSDMAHCDGSESHTPVIASMDKGDDHTAYPLRAVPLESLVEEWLLHHGPEDRPEIVSRLHAAIDQAMMSVALGRGRSRRVHGDPPPS